MLADFVEVTTSDGVLLGGAYFAPTVQQRSSSVEAVCFFHGDTGHFYRALYLELGSRMAAEGIAFLAANRRGHDIVSNGTPGGPLAGYAHESVDESRLDYAAWLELLRERGHESVVIGGHSGGAVRAAYAQSKERYPGVVGIIPVSPGEYNHEGIIELHADEFTDAYSWCVEQVESGLAGRLHPSRDSVGVVVDGSCVHRLLQPRQPLQRHRARLRTGLPRFVHLRFRGVWRRPSASSGLRSGDAQSQAGRLPSRDSRGNRRSHPRLHGPGPPAIRDHSQLAGVDLVPPTHPRRAARRQAYPRRQTASPAYAPGS